MKNNRLRIVAIIPAYNEENSIAKVILRTMRYVDEIIVCDDGSTDLTYRIAEKLGAKLASHANNQGKGAALRTLSKEIMELNSDIIVTLDGDGQHNPDEIPMLLKPIEVGVSDVVIGSRFVCGSKMDAPIYRVLGLRLINFLYKKFAGVLIHDTQSGFRAYSQKAFISLIQCEAKGYGIEGEQLALISKNGLRVKEIPISVTYNGVKKPSKKAPLLHGIELMLTLFRVIRKNGSKFPEKSKQH